MSFEGNLWYNTFTKKVEIMKVSDIMISPVVVTQKNKSVGHVKDVLERKHINAIPVLSAEGEIEGIITATDIAQESNNDRLIENVMTTKTHVVGVSSGVRDAAKMMLKHQVHHLVAMDEGQVVGIVSSMDFVSIVASE